MQSKENNNAKEARERTDNRLVEDDVSFMYARAGGPGGQKVNKTSSKVGLRLHLDTSSNFTEQEKDRIRRAYPGRITKDGDLIVWSQTSRSQYQNKQLVLARTAALIAKALMVATERKKTKISPAKKEKRRRARKLHSQKKASRRPVEL